MSRIIKQAQAERDLLDIWRYTFNEWEGRNKPISTWMTYLRPWHYWPANH